MALFHPTRGGTRGGKDQFKWDDVKTDKDRECYLGHSVMAPVGRWQQGKDITWYASEKTAEGKKRRANEEFQKAKEMEEKALMAALGYRVASKPEPTTSSAHHDEIRGHQMKIETNDYRKEENKVSILKSKSKVDLDKMLIRFLNKYGIEKVIDALDGNTKHKSKKKKKKQHKKSSKKFKKEESSESSFSENDDVTSKQRKRSKYDNKKSNKNYTDSSNSSSSSESD